jgi:DNA-binding MarR family transcriptional regulator
VSTDPQAFFEDLVRFETRLFNAVNERLRAEGGLTLGQYEFLRLIADGEGVRVVDLASAVAIAVGAASKGVDRLEADGMVRRVPNPANRRSSLLEVTDEGRARLEAARPVFGPAVRQWLEPLDPDDLAAVAAGLHRLRRGIEDAGAGSPAG